MCEHIERTEAHNTAGLMRRHIYQGFARAVLLGDEADLANFLTFGFAELDFQVRPSRQDLVLALFKVLMEVFHGLKIPVVVAFDQLEDLLLARRSDDGHRTAEAFFAGIVQAMHQIDGICFLIFAERGLWNRFVPSLDGYIQDRLNNPVHVPGHGTIKALRLEAPPPELVRRVVEARLRPALEELPDFADLPPIFPFTDEQVQRIARTEPTLRDMLQQFRHLFDHLVYGEAASDGWTTWPRRQATAPELDGESAAGGSCRRHRSSRSSIVESPASQAARHATDPPAADRLAPAPATPSSLPSTCRRLWEQEMRAARRKLEPEGALTGATRELQAGLGTVPASLPRARRQGRALAAAARRRRMDLRRPSDLRRHHHRPLGLQGRPAVEGRHRPVPGPRAGQAEGPGNQAGRAGGRAAGHRSSDPAAARGRPGPDRQEQDPLAGSRDAAAGTPGWSRSAWTPSPCSTASRAGWRPSAKRCRRASRCRTWPTCSRNAAKSCWNRCACRCKGVDEDGGLLSPVLQGLDRRGPGPPGQMLFNKTWDNRRNPWLANAALYFESGLILMLRKVTRP